jgi:SAM-dependent methyltransferase
MNEPTAEDRYFERLRLVQFRRWKSLLQVQLPYKLHLRSLKLGFILDVGCGLGRNLSHIGGNGVGIDHNPRSVAFARTRGLTAFTPEDFESSEFNRPSMFDSLLLAHVAEHMTEAQAALLIKKYARLLKPKSRLVIICPQEMGFKADTTHVDFMDFEKIKNVASQVGAVPLAQYSFPFPRFCGRFFRYNEFVFVGRLF